MYVCSTHEDKSPMRTVSVYVLLHSGVTTDDPSDVVFPEMASELATSPHVWLLCGDGIAHNGLTPHGSRYRVNLNSVMPGNRVGVFIHDTGDLHFTLNGDDCGCAAHNVPQGEFVCQNISFCQVQN